MCRQLEGLRQSIAELATGFDARTMLPSEAGAVLRVCGQIEASITTIKALASARLAEGTAWQGEGFRSPAEHLAKLSGMSPSSARRLLETGRRLADQPEVAAAGLAGELSVEKTAAVADGTSANPAKAGELIDKAKSSTLPELQEEVARAKAEVVDLEARRRAIHAKRSFRRWTDSDGAFHARFDGNPEDGVALWRMLDPIRRRLVVLRRQAETGSESLDALDYDALMVIASAAVGADSELSTPDLQGLGLFPGAVPVTAGHAAAGPPAIPPPSTAGDSNIPTLFGSDVLDDEESPHDDVPGHPPDRPPPKKPKKPGFSPAKVILRVDLDTLLRGVVAEGELCEIAGYGPVPVSVVEDLIASGGALVAAVLTKARQIVGVYHFGRRPNAVQATALDFLYPWCAVKGCNARAGLQSDHREDWVKTKFTVFDLLDRLCPHHHRLKTHKGWALVEGTGRREFVPPDDPRHPRSRTRERTRTPAV